MNKATERLKEIEEILNRNKTNFDKRIFRAEKQGILLGLEEGRKKAFYKIKKK